MFCCATAPTSNLTLPHLDFCCGWLRLNCSTCTAFRVGKMASSVQEWVVTEVSLSLRFLPSFFEHLLDGTAYGGNRPPGKPLFGRSLVEEDVDGSRMDQRREPSRPVQPTNHPTIQAASSPLSSFLCPGSTHSSPPSARPCADHGPSHISRYPAP